MSTSETPEGQRKSWRGEFSDLGTEGVRREIKLQRWSPEKLTFARQWLQQEDIRKWQQQAPVETRLSANTLRKLTPYLIGAVLVLFAALRLFRLMRQGM